MSKNILAALAVVCLIAGASLLMRPTATQEIRPLRIGTNPWPGFEYIHLAEKKGFFKEEGVSVQLLRFSALEDAQRAFERGQIDGMASTLVEVLQSYDHGFHAIPVILTDFSNGSDIVVARKGVETITELKGKKVGVELGMLSEFIVARALEKNGLSLSDVQVKGMSQLDMQSALLAGEVDAVHAYPPVSVNIMQHGPQVKKLFDSSGIPGEIVDAISFSPEMVKSRPKEIAALQRAWDKTVTFVKEHPDEAYQIMAPIESISVQEFSEALGGVKIMTMEEQHALRAAGTYGHTIEKVAEVMRKEGRMKSAVKADDFQ